MFLTITGKIQKRAGTECTATSGGSL